PAVTGGPRRGRPGAGKGVAAGLAARAADPLWLPARQWQVGEFQAEDGGTPIVARWRGHVVAPTRYHLGPIPADTQVQAPRFAASDVPLEVFVERQPFGLPVTDTPTADGLRLGVETGQHFLPLPVRRPSAHPPTTDDRGGRPRACAVQPLPDEAAAPLDAASRGYLRLVAGRALDGRRLRAAIAKLRRNAVPEIGMPIASLDAAE